MLYVNNKVIEEAKNTKYRVYSNEPLQEGVECFPTLNKCIDKDTYYVTSVKAENIRCDKSNGKYRFYFTNEDLSAVADWFPAHVIPIGTKFVKAKKKAPIFKYAKVVDDNVGKKIDGQGCLVDISQLPAFNVDTTNEDLVINDYKFYLTLFKEYTISQCIYERSKLYDAKITSSKYDLATKLQNSDFLKSKDFTVINLRRSKLESVPVGYIIKDSKDKYVVEYGTVYIDMNNIVSIKWN